MRKSFKHPCSDLSKLFFREQILKQHQQKTEYLQAATFALDQHYAGIDSEAQQEYQSTRDDIKNQVV